MVIGDGTLVKVVSWYDNEWGYSNRCVELAGKVLEPARAERLSRASARELLQGKRPRRRGRGQAGAGAGRLQRAARRRRGSPTTPGSAPRCRRSSCCASAAPRSSSSPTSGRPKGTASRSSRWRRSAERLGELLGGRGEAGARRWSATRSRRWPAGSAPGDVLLLENAASSRARPRTTRSSPRRSPSSPTSTSTTPSAPPTAPTRAPRASRTCLPGYAGLLLEREVTS